MMRSARPLLWVGVTVTAVAVASVAHAASSPPTVTTNTVRALPATKTTAATVTKAATTVRSATTSAPAVYRVQAGAARTRTGATKLTKAALTADPTGGYIVTGSGTTWRVVSGCRTVTAAATIKATLTQHGIASIVYRSKRC